MYVTVLITVAVVALLIYIFGQKISTFWLYYLRLYKLPGTKMFPFIGAPYIVLRIPKEDQMDVLKTMNYQGDGLTVATVLFHGVVIITKPQYMEAVLRSDDLMTKSILYEPLAPWLGKGLVMSTGPQYFRDRRLISQAFHYSILQTFTDVMIEKVDIFNSCIERMIEIHGDKPFDIFEMALKCALDIMCETAMGVNIHAQEKVHNEYIDAVETITNVGFERSFQPLLHPDCIFYRTPTGKAFAAAIKTADNFSNHVITKKREERKLGITMSDDESNEKETTGKRKAFLDLLLEVSEKDDNPLTDEELRAHTNTLMFAGHDTSGVLLGWSLFCLGIELDVQKKLHKELDEVLGDDSDDQTILKLLPKLKYLERVIKEVLRLYPSAPFIGRKVTEDIQIGDFTVPKDTSLMAFIYSIHRDPSVWPNPLRFDPDRFLPENIKGRHPYAYVPFSSGPRSCVGQKFAMLEIKLMLVKVMKKFTVKSIENHSIKKYCAIILRPIDGLYVNMTKRSKRTKE